LFLLGIWAFIKAATVKGRIFVAAVIAVLFSLRILWPGLTGYIFSVR
jgi:hypothetical protein